MTVNAEDLEKKSIYFVTGIDTDIGKSFATGLIGRFFLRLGKHTITHKIVQTGVTETIADDILLHRRLMGIEPYPEDRDGTTCSYRFNYPASPHLAARMENRSVNPSKITSDTRRLLDTFEVVLLEGAGGLFVPLHNDYSIIDYLSEQQYPLVLVSSGRLGSINHTLLSLEATLHRGIPLAGIVFNRFPETDKIIEQDTLRFFRHALDKLDRSDALVEIPTIDFNDIPEIDFSPLFDF